MTFKKSLATGIVLISITGCTINYSGHRLEALEQENLQTGDLSGIVEPGVTTVAELTAKLGPPEDKLFSDNGKTTTYTYKWIRSSSIGLPIPFLYIGTDAQKGYSINFFISNGVIIGYEISLLKETLL